MRIRFTGLWLILFLTAAASAFPQGSVLLMGGGDDRGSWADDPFSWFVQKADSGIIINIDVDEVATSYAETFKSHGADPASYSLRIRNTAAANDSATYRQLISASGIWIEGGDQYDYVREWKGTLAEQAIREVFQKGGVVGGTSAGCAVLGEVDFIAEHGGAAPEDLAYNPYSYNATLTNDFLPLIPNVLTDSHFHSRGRLGRLVPFLARRIQDHGETGLTGVGVADQTAFCIEADLSAAVCGQGSVTVLYADPVSEISCISGKPVRFTHMHMDQLIHGVIYDLDTHTLIDPGPDLQPVNRDPDLPVYSSVLLSGSDEQSAGYGEVRISNYTHDDMDAWYGRLNTAAGDTVIPQTVVIPRIWSDSNYYENRWIGGMMCAADFPLMFAVFLDDNATAAVGAGGNLTAGTLAYIMDMHEVTYTGDTSTRNTDYRGFIGARLHFLTHGDNFSLKKTYTEVDYGRSAAVPSELRLFQNYPNPFNTATTFHYMLPAEAEVHAAVYDLSGKERALLVSGTREAGPHEAVWHADTFASGLYVFRIRAGTEMRECKCLLLK